jgi:hypothetical protein
MADWFRKHFVEPVHNLEDRLVHKVEDLGGSLVKSVYLGSTKVLSSFEAAGSAVMHKAANTVYRGFVRVDKGIERGLHRVEGAALTVLHNAEHAGSNLIHHLEDATVRTARTINNRFIHPLVHAIEQPIENAWHETEHVVSGVLHSLARPFQIIFYGGMLIGGFWLYRAIEGQREESASKRRRYT